MGAYVYSPGGDYVGYMNDDDCLYDAYDSYWGYAVAKVISMDPTTTTLGVLR